MCTKTVTRTDRMMGKQRGKETQGAKAKAQKAEALKQKEEAAHAVKMRQVDKQWNVGANQRGNEREQAAIEKQEEKRLKELEKKTFLEAEEAELSGMKKPQGKARKAQKAKKKANNFDALDAFLAEEKKEKEKKSASSSRISEMPNLVANTNKQRTADEKQGIYTASGVENAISALNLASASVESGGVNQDAHPEKRAKAAYLAFEEKRMESIKKDFPGLKRSQYKEKIWKEWQKSAENPFNMQQQQQQMQQNKC